MLHHSAQVNICHNFKFNLYILSIDTDFCINYLSIWEVLLLKRNIFWTVKTTDFRSSAYTEIE